MNKILITNGTIEDNKMSKEAMKKLAVDMNFPKKSKANTQTERKQQKKIAKKAKRDAKRL